jgi:hypothetical protein
MGVVTIGEDTLEVGWGVQYSELVDQLLNKVIGYLKHREKGDRLECGHDLG